MPTGQVAFIKDAQGHVTKVAEQGLILTTESYPILKNGYPMSISAASGGTQLPSLAITKVTLVNLSGNGVMFVGGNSDDAPFSGRGFWLWPQNVPPHEHTCYIDDLSKVQVCSTISGQLLQYIGYMIGQNDSIDPETQGSAPDPTIPYIVSHTPTANQSGVATNSEISIISSEDLLNDSINTSSFRVTRSGQVTPISGIIDQTLSTTTVFTPESGQLATALWYNVILESGITDLSQNNLSGSPYTFAFRTLSTNPGADVTPPTITSSNPVSGATNVATNSTYTVTFSEQVLSGTINTNTFKLRNASGTNISISVTLGADKKTATIDPSPTLGSIMEHRISISGVKDLAGNNMVPVSGIRWTTKEPSLTQIWNHTNTGLNEILEEDSNNRAGIFSENSASALRGHVVRKAQWWLKRVGNPAGNVTCTVRDGDNGDDLQREFTGTIPASSLTTSYAQYSFYDLSGTYEISTDDKISIEFNQGGTSNYVDMSVSSTDSDDTIFYRLHVDDGTVHHTDRSARVTLWE